MTMMTTCHHGFLIALILRNSRLALQKLLIGLMSNPKLLKSSEENANRHRPRPCAMFARKYTAELSANVLSSGWLIRLQKYCRERGAAELVLGNTTL